jgi:DNA-directed RNA polymerase sigma subunit (sigma70/sigma32)
MKRRRYDGAMEFQEIGKRLGISKGAAQQIFVRAMRKLHRADWTKVFEAQREMDALRTSPVYPDWDCWD